ncbi:MAG: hypothetical protein AYK18_07320 [Theionarchaea archaeon DG-70]|nr:MAG: hypothetical protein AYK18_07320 [Theionarchaea archaeon DG-70]
MKESLRIRIQRSYDKYGWTNEQVEVFEKWLNERCANFKRPENTIRGYLDTLNCIVSEVKKPFCEMTTDDLFPILAGWEGEYSEATIYGRKRKLKAFLRWESGNRHDPRAEKIRVGSYVSPVTLNDLLTDEEIAELRTVAKDDPRNLAMLDFHLLWGPRPSESIELKVGDVKVLKDRYIVVYIPQVKTTFRPVPIPLARVSVITDPVFLDSALNAYISMMNYLSTHPGYPNEPERPLWYNGYDGYKKPLTGPGLTAVFRRLGKQAGLKKPVTTYVLRRTAFNRFKGADREKLCAGFGWEPGSKMPRKVYNKLRPQDHLEALIRSDDEEERNIRICSQCNKENPNIETFCAWCGAPLVELPASATLEQFHADREAQEELEDLREKMAKVEELLGNMVEVPGFEKIMEKAAKHSK